MSRVLLRIAAPYFVAGVVYKRRENGWKRTDCAPILRRKLPRRVASMMDLANVLPEAGYSCTDY